ncbi:MAG: patatin-like phospholipase family protein [Burkholderiales bacterium]
MNPPGEDPADPARPLTFDEVLQAEQAAGCRPPGKSLGLAFSGGGIRSATFNLGVIQALCELRLLRRFDYLSTISGGGYIGGWLSMFIHRRGRGNVGSVEEALGKREGNLEDSAIRFLRSFSNYLTPQVGFSNDTITAIATYLRNLVLTLSVLIALFAAALILPRIVVLGVDHLASWQQFEHGFVFPTLTVAVLLVTTCVVTLNLFYQPTEKPIRWPWYTRPLILAALVDLPVVVAAIITTSYFLRVIDNGGLDATAWIASVVVTYVLLWLLGLIVAKCYPSKALHDFTRVGFSARTILWFLAFLFFALLAGTLGGAVTLGIARAIAAIPECHQLWAAVVFGPPAIIIAITLMVVAHVGLMAREFSESDRELWSTLGGRLLRIAVVWAVAFTIALYGPAAIGFANDWVARAGGVAWIASTLFGVLAGRSRATGKPDAKPWIEILTRLAPYVFVLGLLIVLSWGVHAVLAIAHDASTDAAATSHTALNTTNTIQPRLALHTTSRTNTTAEATHETDPPSLWVQFLQRADDEYANLRLYFEPAYALPLILAGVILAALLLSWRINVNLFSLHHFYRNRLTRCYLGATNDNRRPHPLTGFDPDDDVRLSVLREQKPLHIIGTAINLNRGKQLAWQNRRAASFAFTPLHAGYEPASRQVAGGYRDTAMYGRDANGTSIQLGSVVAISGAAASPNQGFHTSPAVAFLLTVFNVRLGHWCGNTTDASAWRSRDPLFSLRYWWAEFTGRAGQDDRFVSLSDGGHFENLGIYELVRRRCGLILASDAGADPQYAFDDLAEAIRKCYTDFGVEIRFRSKVDDIRSAGAGKPSVRHHAVADIIYPNQTFQGTLVYWKSSLTDNTPPDIMHYQRSHNDFPHESTADQFFDESQFESYRHLGYEVARQSIATMRENGELPEALR